MHLRTDWQSTFSNALLQPDEPVPLGLQDPHGEPTVKRFAVYRNNVVAGLTEALKVGFPAVCRIVGEEFFAAMARVFVIQDQPRSPVLLEYGENFATFIGNFMPAKSLPYLADVARIERGWLEAYHAPESIPLHALALASIPSEELYGVRFHIHPSVRLIRSSFPAFTIWSTNIDGASPMAVDLESGGENVLVSRPTAEVEIRTVSDGAAEFIRSVAEGNTVCEAARTALTSDTSFNLSSTLSRVMETGIFVGYDSDDPAIMNDKRGHCGD